MPPATESTASEHDAQKRGRVSVRALLLLAAVAVGIYVIDQLVKHLVVSTLQVGQQVDLLGSLLQLHYVTNSGAAFSLGAGFTWILSIVALGVIGFIVWFARRIRSTAWAVLFGLVLGGAFGNLTDRVFRDPGFGQGHVVDFFQLWGFPAIFNVADVAITAAAVLFVLISLRGIGVDGQRAGREAAAESAGSQSAGAESAVAESAVAESAGSESAAGRADDPSGDSTKPGV